MSESISQGDVTILRKIAGRISEITGNKFENKIESLVASRIKRRMIVLRFDELADYWSFLKDNQEEWKTLIGVLTTHHTYFFRETAQFDYLIRELPQIWQRVCERGEKCIRIWSAACSYGHEVYTLAMTLQKHIEDNRLPYRFEVYGSDVDADAIDTATNGVYKWEQVKEIPGHYLKRFWQRGTGDIIEFARIKKEIKDHCHFQTLNLLSVTPATFTKHFDVILCRNVFIYFSEEQIHRISEALAKHLHDEGFLMLGLSEKWTQPTEEFQFHGTSTYKKSQVQKLKTASISAKPAAAAKTTPAMKTPSVVVSPEKAKPLRVVCVDDSPTVLAILKKVFAADRGFEVVGTALNASDGHKLIEQVRPDFMTLDIHMPGMSGIEYVKQYVNENHPPVLIISSVDRADVSSLETVIDAGQLDFVEKPSLSDLDTKSEEIRNKVSLLVSNYKRPAQGDLANLSLKSSAVSTECRYIVLWDGKKRDSVSYVISRLSSTGAKVEVHYSSSAHNTGDLEWLKKQGRADYRYVSMRSDEIATHGFLESDLVFVLGEGFRIQRDFYRTNRYAFFCEEPLAQAHKAGVPESWFVGPVTSFIYESEKKIRALSSRKKAS